MRTNSSCSATLFILFNILFSIPTQGQDANPSDPAAAPPAPSSPPAALNCSQCRINPTGLAACGLLINGVLTPNTVGSCCRTVRALTKDEGAACLCYAIKINTIKIGNNIDVLTAVDNVLALCSSL